MTPVVQAIAICDARGLDFDDLMAEHFRDGYVWSSPTAFILALPGWRDGDAFTVAQDGDSWWITLAVGSVAEFLQRDPTPRQWVGFSRADRKPHWIPYDRLIRQCRRAVYRPRTCLTL